MKKGDLVRFEYLSRHSSGVGWEFHRGVGVIVKHDLKEDSYAIMTKSGNMIERLDIQLELISENSENVEKNEG